MSVAVILGSAFSHYLSLHGYQLTPVVVSTEYGDVTLYEFPRDHASDLKSYVILRHGYPYHDLPNQINYRGYAAALKKVSCQALLITSSVGVMKHEIPLYTPLLVTDLLMPYNIMPDGR